MNKLQKDFCVKNFFKILIACTILFSFFYILSPFTLPVILGGILAMAFSPFIQYLIKKRIGRKFSMILLTLFLFLSGAIPITIVFIRGTKSVNNILSEQLISSTKHKFENQIYSILDRFSEINNFDSNAVRIKFDLVMENIGSYALSILSNLLTHIPSILMLGIITLLSFYFFLSNEDSIRELFNRYLYFSENNGNKFIHLLKTSCKEVFFSNIVTGIVQASIVTIGAYFCNIGDSFIIFFCTLLLSFVPIFGAGPFAFSLALIALLDKRVGASIAMMIVSIFSGVADNILRPYLAGSGEVEIHGFITFLSMIGGVLVLGLPGLFVGPLLGLLTFGALPIILDEYFPERNEKLK